MPRTRPEVDRLQKVTEILDAAEKDLRAGGYEALSVAALARRLGLAHNAIYWYFPSKDHLVVATFEHIIAKVLAGKKEIEGDLVEKVAWFIDQLGALYPLRASLQARAQRSEVIGSYLATLSERLTTMIRNVLRPYVPQDELDVAVAAFAATVQGAFLEGSSPEKAREVIMFSLRKLIAHDRPMPRDDHKRKS